ncbi:lytic transglycosylase domain-containing protein [Helicobacter sp. 11S02629-2]|uniref:lytic transglycosylase domain-containing protein n=1 Tax=Helicobacter sp. 11S02629-2 TaxID=1476195 RepID=UPI002151678A|nr:lytic transglycosylase domain-containing protein [Helicobacter sp. 11S02629-2]
MLFLSTTLGFATGLSQDSRVDGDGLFVDMGGQDSYPDIHRFNPQTINQYNASLLNSLSVKSEFLASLKSNDNLINIDTRRWVYLLSQYENGKHIVSTLRKMLSDANVPQEFLFLAMAESEFKSKAYSSKKAAGIWQLMPTTARELGLVINSQVDERRDPIKSTEAAIKYLRFLYKSTGKWYLAAIAYNCGLGRLQKGIKAAGTDDLEVLLDKHKQYIPLETRNYIRKILAMSLAFNDVNNLNQENKTYLLNMGANDSIVTVHVSPGTSLSKIARSADMSLSALKKYNSHFKENYVPLGRIRYSVYLPYEKLSYFKQNFKDSNKNSVFLAHTVKAGDTLSSIAKKYHISVSEIKDANGLKSAFLSINQKLILPIDKYKYQRLAANDKKTEARATTKTNIRGQGYYVHTVKEGDTLSSIAKKYNISIREIKDANSLNSSFLSINQKLILPVVKSKYEKLALDNKAYKRGF